MIMDNDNFAFAADTFGILMSPESASQSVSQSFCASIDGCRRNLAESNFIATQSSRNAFCAGRQIGFRLFFQY